VKLLDFMIIGAQKSGTSALAHFLDQHPDVGFSSTKECHVFDADDYSSAWTRDDVQQRYSAFFTDYSHDLKWGEATPIYLFLPEIAAELSRYNPRLKLIVILRDPVERTISHYLMEYNRGNEERSFWLALLLEPVRLMSSKSHRSMAYRNYSYRRRSLYSRQLRNLYRFFDSAQVLLLDHEALLTHHQQAFKEVCEFIGIDSEFEVEQELIFNSAGPCKRYPLLRWLLKLSFLFEYRRIRRYLPFTIDHWLRMP